MIIAIEKGITYNEFGNEEMYVKKEIEKIKSNYSNESEFGINEATCETCDSALCDSCRTAYIVRIYGKPFLNSICAVEYPIKEISLFPDEYLARSYYDSVKC